MLTIDVSSDLFEISGEDGPEVAERFFVTFSTSCGRRFQHIASFSSVELVTDPEEGAFYRRVWDALSSTEALARRIEAHLKAGGKLDPACWYEVAPVYGSEAYIAFEASEIAPAVDFIRRGGDPAELPAAVRACL